MSEHSMDFEGKLSRALTPVEPPERLSERLELRLEALNEVAREELETWELSAMRDPRNWMRPVVAAAIATTAGAGLVLLRARARHRRRAEKPRDPLDFARRAIGDVAEETRRLRKRG